MLRNYFKIAWRNFTRNKFYSLINLGGLTIAITVFVFISLFVTNELSFDQHFADADRIYRIVQEDTKTNTLTFASVSPGVGTVIAEKFPEIEISTELGLPNRELLSINTKNFYLDDVFGVDNKFFNVFDFKTLKGSIENAFELPGRIVLSQSTSRVLFGDEEPIGKIIDYENKLDLEVVAVVEDAPANTHFKFSALRSLTPREIETRNKDVQWQYFNYGYVYAKLKPGATIDNFDANLKKYEETANVPEWMAGEYNLATQPLTSIHLGTPLGNEIAAQGSMTNIYLFGAIGILLLMLACINYMNLSSAQALERSREVGVRKTFGAQRSQLVLQFLSESVLIALITLPLAYILVEAFLPYINSMLELNLSLLGNQYQPLLLLLPMVAIITGLVSGSYPAIYLSSLKPGNAFSNKAGSSGTNLFRNSLVVFQFAVSLLLIVSTIVIHSQLSFVHEKKLGFEKEHIITFSSGILKDAYSAFKQLLTNDANIVSVTSGPPPGLGHKNFTTTVTDPDSQQEITLSAITADFDYPETFDLTLKKGRLFSKEYSTDPGNAVLLTEEGARVLAFNEDSTGNYITLGGEEKQVIGIIENYHNASLFEPIQPVVLLLTPGHNWTGIIRLAAGNTRVGIETVQNAWRSFFPNRPLEFSFLDQRIDKQYREDQKIASLFSVFTAIALFVACIGLLGLSAFTARKRIKEIGIRKVLGASIGDVVALLSKDFLKLVLIGFAVSVPISWYVMNKWLTGFAYKIELGAGLFLAAGAGTILIALATVSWQSIKAALANPIDSLKSE